MNQGAKILLALAVPVVLGWGLVELLQRDVSKPNREIATEMYYSFAAESQTDNDVLKGGHSQLAPPEGTLYHGQLAPGMGWDENDKVDYLQRGALAKDFSPPPVGDEAAQAAQAALGAKRFAKYCEGCHGAAGLGNAPLLAAGFPMPPNVVAGRAASLSDGELFEIIYFGQNKMQPQGGRVPANDIWAIIQHLRQLQGKGAK